MSKNNINYFPKGVGPDLDGLVKKHIDAQEALHNYANNVDSNDLTPDDLRLLGLDADSISAVLEIKKLSKSTLPNEDEARMYEAMHSERIKAIDDLVIKLQKGFAVLDNAELELLFTSESLKKYRHKNYIEEYLPIFFKCTKGEVAHSLSEINKDTKVYVGPLEPSIFQKLPETIEHVYTSFPEKKIRRENVEIGGKSAEQLIREMDEAGINILTYAKSMLQNNREFIPGSNREKVTLIRLTVADLGFRTSATTDQIFERAEALGLELCPPDTGPNYRLKYRNQTMGERLYIGMKPIIVSDGRPIVFSLERREDGLWLNGFWASPAYAWSPDSRFAFRLRKSES